MSLRIDVEYGAGHFDKDEQGWCAHVHRVRREGDFVHVEEHGNRAGLVPFRRSWTARIESIDEPNEIVVLARADDRVVFDLRTQRLLSPEQHVSESAPLAIPPCPETFEPFVRWGLAVLARLTRTNAVEGALEPDGTRGTGEDFVIRSGQNVVARITRFESATGLHGIDIGVSKLTLGWRAALRPRAFDVRGWIATLELARLRSEVRATESPWLVRPSLLHRLITNEVREVGSRLSEIDHGGSAAAWERIAQAGTIVRSAHALLPEVCASTGLSGIEAFASSPSSTWSELDRPAELEPAPLVDACTVLALAPRAHELARALAGAALEAIPSDHALRPPLVAVRDAGDHAALDAALRLTTCVESSAANGPRRTT
jgi:hypothetical protein